MANADYNYSIDERREKPLILIEDMNLGNMSVTNDIEIVVAEICEKRGINCNEATILYMDSEGLWDGYDCAKKQFIPLHGKTWNEALERL